MAKLKLLVYRDEKREWRWRLVAPNGRILADSGEGYKKRQGALKGFASIRENLAKGLVKTIVAN